MATRPIYRGNPARSWRANHGLKKQDDLDGHWTYESLLIQDDDGNQVDARGLRTYDRRYDLDGSNR